MTKPYISLLITNKSGETISKVRSRKTRRIFNFIQEANFQDCVLIACVNYGGGFKNKGKYQNKKELIYALRAFLE